MQSLTDDSGSIAERTRSKRSLPNPFVLPSPKRRRVVRNQVATETPATAPPALQQQEPKSTPHMGSGSPTQEVRKVPSSQLEGLTSAVTLALSNGASRTGALIKRIILKAQGNLLRDIRLDPPFNLGHRNMSAPLTVPNSNVMGATAATSSLATSSMSGGFHTLHSGLNQLSICNQVTPSGSRRQRGNGQPAGTLENLQIGLETPQGSLESVASFAQPGAWCDPAKGGAGGPYRQIRSERTGYFKEDSILMGVRYVLG